MRLIEVQIVVNSGMKKYYMNLQFHYIIHLDFKTINK